MVETDLESDALRGPPAQFPHIRYDPRYDEWAAYIDPDRENPTTYFDNPGRAGIFYPNLMRKEERVAMRRFVHATPHHPTPDCLLGVDLDPDPDR
jgi:hypothetical protein